MNSREIVNIRFPPFPLPLLCPYFAHIPVVKLHQLIIAPNDHTGVQDAPQIQLESFSILQHDVKLVLALH